MRPDARGPRARRPTRHIPPSLRDEKICAACGRPFSWRRKWERVWDEVKYCSDACKAKRS
ncbi:MAG: DUF2256 domain-containing protein [Chloroflexi bacterium]|nr:MAG: DUF2256 domain-containing protein [Chloroflexota bacterium]RLT29636.1 MAG: DUF2256 domain-containing protein [Chloroflexota bacterium]